MNSSLRISFVSILVLSATLRAADFHVAPAGKDTNPGTSASPLATLDAARDAARAAGPGPHRILLLPGDYFLSATLQLDARDNGLTLESAEPRKATLYGGRLITGWRRDGEKFWCADLPGVKDGAWDFRALLVNGRLAERSRVPETGTLVHRSVFDVAVVPAVAGWWARQPTLEERTTMQYDPKDIPATFEMRNAELRIYHMWDASLVGIAAHDPQKSLFTLSAPATSPPGAFGIKKYIIVNTREGMTRPGQWYLDRAAGRVVYWPLPDEDMASARLIAPSLERLVGIVGTTRAPAEKITLRGLVLQATTTPLKPAGFAAMGNYDGAVRMEWATQCALDDLEITNVGGLGILARELTDCQVRRCHIHHVGAAGASINGSATLLANNHVHHVGLYHPSAAAVGVSHRKPDESKGVHVQRNEIHDAPYCGLIVSGHRHLVEQNLIYRVMQELHDGAGIYGGARHSIIRNNVVRDIAPHGSGFGVSAYYLDEGAEDTLIERNVSINVQRPTHNHITSNVTIRDNVFVTEADMRLSFQRSRGVTFVNNTIVAPGKISVAQPNAVKEWSGNLIIREGLNSGGRPFTIDDAMPPTEAPARRTAPFDAARAPAPPKFTGEAGWEEWPGTMHKLDREPSRWSATGAPAYVRISYDDRCLYIAARVVVFDVGALRKGSAWGKDDGMEICIPADTGTFVLRGFVDGTVQSVRDGGASPAAAERLGKSARFVATPYGKTKGDWKSGWRGEWAIPLEALGLKIQPNKTLPVNIGVYRSQDDNHMCLEGTLADNWRLPEAATLRFK